MFRFVPWYRSSKQNKLKKGCVKHFTFHITNVLEAMQMSYCVGEIHCE